MYRKLPESHDDVLGYEVAGRVSEDEYQEMITEVREAIEDHGSVRVLVRMHEVPGTDLSTFGDRLRFMKESIGNIERYAVVSDDNKAEWVSRIGDKVTPVDFKHFSKSQEPDAWQWVASRAAV